MKFGEMKFGELKFGELKFGEIKWNRLDRWSLPVPSKFVKSRKRRRQWLNPAVCRLIRKRDRLAKVAKKSGLLIDHERYRKACNTASEAIETEYHKW